MEFKPTVQGSAVPANQIQQYVKRIIQHDKAKCMSGMQGWVKHEN